MQSNQNKKQSNKITKKILITAGPTIEPIDPVRYISNHSTGTMGYEIAAAASKEYQVCLITGPTDIAVPKNVELVRVKTAVEMEKAVLDRIDEYDCLIMAAAVSDFRPEKTEDRKIKKKDELILKLIKNPDILMRVKGKDSILKVGFALETENAEENGKEKLRKKNLDLIVINALGGGSNPFGSSDHPEENRRDYVLAEKGGEVYSLKQYTKKEMATKLIDEVKRLLER